MFITQDWLSYPSSARAKASSPSEHGEIHQISCHELLASYSLFYDPLLCFYNAWIGFRRSLIFLLRSHQYMTPVANYVSLMVFLVCVTRTLHAFFNASSFCEVPSPAYSPATYWSFPPNFKENSFWVEDPSISTEFEQVNKKLANITNLSTLRFISSNLMNAEREISKLRTRIELSWLAPSMEVISHLLGYLATRARKISLF
jgi:hypothetical protein